MQFNKEYEQLNVQRDEWISKIDEKNKRIQ